MRDGIEQGTWESHRPKLTYPFDHAPKIGEAVDIERGREAAQGTDHTVVFGREADKNFQTLEELPIPPALRAIDLLAPLARGDTIQIAATPISGRTKLLTEIAQDTGPE